MSAVSTVGGLLAGKQSSGEKVSMEIPGMTMTIAKIDSDSEGRKRNTSTL